MTPTQRTALSLAALFAAIVVVGVLAVVKGEHPEPIDPVVVASPIPPPSLQALPVLHNGRVKPFAVAADETVWSLTGKSHFGVVQRGGAADTGALVLDLFRDPEAWKTRPLLDCPLFALRERIGLRTGHASLEQLDEPPTPDFLIRAAQLDELARQSSEVIPLDRLDKSAAELAGRLSQARWVLAGHAFQLVPLLTNADQRAWAEGLGEALADHGEHFRPWRSRLHDALQGVAAARTAVDEATAWTIPETDIWLTLGELALDPDPLLDGWPDPQGIRESARAWAAALRSGAELEAPSADLAQRLAAAGSAHVAGLATIGRSVSYPSASRLAMELTYRRTRPFTWAWIAFVLGGILAGIGVATGRRVLRGGGIGLTVCGIVVVVAGLTVRLLLGGQGMVTNLYETTIWVSLVAAVIGLVLSSTTGNGWYVAAAGVAAGLCAMVGEAMPPESATVQQLQPVLRSQLWLFTHVKTIVASYAAFLVAWALGNIVLWRAVHRGSPVAEPEARAIYRALQIGVVLVAAGTLLGGAWADESWGRFWGWDPKEVWALVILLVYLVPLHLRYAGAVSATGLAAWAVAGFLSVVMSWYGVNFLLGAGKHAYATGSGFGDSFTMDRILVLGLSVVQILLTTFQVIALRRMAATWPTPPTPGGVGQAGPTGT